MSGRFCRMTGCFKTEIGDTQRCEVHTEAPRCEMPGCLGWKLVNSRFCPIHTGVEPKSDPSDEVFIKYKDIIHEARFEKGAIIATRYDSDGQSIAIPHESEFLGKATPKEIVNYRKQKKYYLSALNEPSRFIKAFKTAEAEDRTWKYNKSVDDILREAEASSRPGMEPVETDFSTELQKVLCEMESLLVKKNKDYGSSYDDTVEELGETVILIRLKDKYNRLKQLILSGNEPEVAETIEETLSDLVGYGIIELVRRRR